MKKILIIVAALAAVLGVSLAAPAQASGPKPAAVQVTSNSMAALAGCPTGDGPVTWGKAKACPQSGNLGRIHLQDSLTDGYCVQARYWSADQSSWRAVGPNACTTGQWRTFDLELSNICASSNIRLYRGDGTYFTMPNTAC